MTDVKTFTGRKLDLLRCVRFDRRIPDYAYRVISVIADHLNAETGRTMISDDTIAFETGSKWPRKVGRARKILLEGKWLKWRHSKTANIYELDYTKVEDTLAMIGRARYERRQKFFENELRLGRHRPTAAPLAQSDKNDHPDSDAGVRQTP